MKNKKYVLGVDIGATSVKIGLVDKNGKIAAKISFPTKEFISKEIFINGITKKINQIIKQANISKKNLAGIGVGVPGTVDYAKGIVHDLTNIKGWREVPLKKILNKFFKLPLYIDNDANAFAQGELRWGAAHGSMNALCVTVGSGVGGGLIINGEVYRGSSYSAGEIGHICIDIDGPVCGCGRKGCLEAFVGNKYIIGRAIEKISARGRSAKSGKAGKKTILIDMVKGDLSIITPKMITKAAGRNDSFSIEIWKEIGTYLGIGLGGLVNVLNPERVIVGGGVSKAGKFILNPLKEELARRAMKAHLKKFKVIRAHFVDTAGIIGAASLIDV